MKTPRQSWTHRRKPYRTTRGQGISFKAQGSGEAALFSQEFDEDALGALAVEVGIKDLLPGAEVEPALGQSDDDVALQGQVLQEDGGVAFVLGAVFVVFADGRELFEPVLEVAMQAGVVFRDEYGGI